MQLELHRPCSQISCHLAYYSSFHDLFHFPVLGQYPTYRQVLSAFVTFAVVDAPEVLALLLTALTWPIEHLTAS